MLQRTRDSIRVFGAFFALGMRLALSYPVSFAVSQLGSIVSVVVYFFVAQLVPGDRASVGGDYFSFVMLGLIASQLMSAGLQSFGGDLSARIQQGQFEMLLTEPVGWRFLPIGIAAWPTSWQIVTSLIIAFVAVLLGASFLVQGIPLALLIGLLGLIAGLAIGVLSGAVRVLSKGGDPVMAIYLLVVGVVSGALFPIELLPPILRAIAWLLPSTYLVYGLRAALLPGAAGIGGPDAAQAVMFLLVFDLMMFPVAIAVFGRSLEVGRRLGVLAGY